MRWGAIAFLAIFIIDVAVAWGMYVLFRDVHADLSLLSAWFRLTYTVMLGTAIVFLFMALLTGDPVLSRGDASAQVLMDLRAFDFTWVTGLAAFGAHLVLTGHLLLRSGRAPRVLAWTLYVAGAAYVVDTVAHLAIPDYEAWSATFLMIVAVPSILSELGLTVWLLRAASRWHRVPDETLTRSRDPSR